MSSVGKSLLKGAEESLAYVKGFKENSVTHKVIIPKNIDVLNIRHHLHMSRKTFRKNLVSTFEHLKNGNEEKEYPKDLHVLI